MISTRRGDIHGFARTYNLHGGIGRNGASPTLADVARKEIERQVAVSIIAPVVTRIRVPKKICRSKLEATATCARPTQGAIRTPLISPGIRARWIGQTQRIIRHIRVPIERLRIAEIHSLHSGGLLVPRHVRFVYPGRPSARGEG